MNILILISAILIKLKLECKVNYKELYVSVVLSK